MAIRMLLKAQWDPFGLRAVLRTVRRVCPRAALNFRQLLIDVSVLARSDAGTGIQRATKELLRELKAAPPEGYAVRTVRASRWSSYRYAEGPPDSLKLRVNSGDIFLGLDLASRILPRHRLQLIRWQLAGASICVVMHDLLPLQHPEWFTRRNSGAYRNWIRTVAVHADSVLCVSRTVAEEFRSWLSSVVTDPESLPSIGWFHHGARPPDNMGIAAPDSGIARVTSHPFVLMVGTIEPRKGHALALEAFESLWQEGDATQLVIVGRVGWAVDALVTKLRNHPETGTRLHWFDDANDQTLHTLYAAATGVLLASEAEGFGLPILEAALHGKPLFVRDLPVFREIAGNGATYFSSRTSRSLATEIAQWLERAKAGTAIASSAISYQSWSESARQLLAQLKYVGS